jgi:hypothetical protein
MRLDGTRVALLIEDDYEAMEAWYPRLRLEEARADVQAIGKGPVERPSRGRRATGYDPIRHDSRTRAGMSPDDESLKFNRRDP